MRMLTCFLIEKSQIINTIDSNFTMRMDYIVVIQKNPHMNNVSFIVIKKSQITRLTFFDKTQYFSLTSLLMCISEQLVSIDLVDHLRKARAVYAKRSSASPKTPTKAGSPVEVVVEHLEAAESLPPTSANAASLIVGRSPSPLVAMVQKN